MGNANKDEIIEGTKELTLEQQEIILYLADIFEGEEEIILDYCNKEFI